ncbi:MAG: DUF2281 domain-containing protein [Saprospiraceae bacterium]|jgi:hypothetical protein|nr:DUF2281 domain-containing protein [Saprospiraceae bacterium]
MNEQRIIYEIYRLPESLKVEVMHFIEFLKNEYTTQPAKKSKGKRVFGRVKGKYILAPDFDEPLEDFKEYMQ